jgi:hypothetical protein
MSRRTGAILIVVGIPFFYVASFGPAWSVAVRLNAYDIMRLYDPIPAQLQARYLRLWMKVDKRAVEGLM